MGAVEVNVGSSVCRRCGIAYSRLKGYFPVCYSSLYKGTGYLPYCRTCVDALLADYYVVTKDYKSALRQVCRKLDLYWSDDLYEQTARQTSTRSLMTNYITRSNGIKYVGKSYDDTLEEEGTLWVWDSIQNENAHKDMEPPEEPVQEEPETVEEPEEIIEIAEETMMFWGPGYTNKVYHELEQRFQYYKAQMNDVQMDVGTEALLRQIVMLEIDINKARAEGKQVDKMVNALNTLLGSAALKPAQKKEDTDSSVLNTPFGVWIKRWEDERPVPDIDPELRDVDGIVKYIQVWFYGHLCKMLGIKNTYSRLYEDEIARLRVERPEFNDEDDESMIYDIFGGDKSEE